MNSTKEIQVNQEFPVLELSINYVIADRGGRGLPKRLQYYIGGGEILFRLIIFWLFTFCAL